MTARNERVGRTIDMYKFVFITSAPPPSPVLCGRVLSSCNHGTQSPSGCTLENGCMSQSIAHLPLNWSMSPCIFTGSSIMASVFVEARHYVKLKLSIEELKTISWRFQGARMDFD